MDLALPPPPPPSFSFLLSGESPPVSAFQEWKAGGGEGRGGRGPRLIKRRWRQQRWPNLTERKRRGGRKGTFSAERAIRRSRSKLVSSSLSIANSQAPTALTIFPLLSSMVFRLCPPPSASLRRHMYQSLIKPDFPPPPPLSTGRERRHRPPPRSLFANLINESFIQQLERAKRKREREPETGSSAAGKKRGKGGFSGEKSSFAPFLKRTLIGIGWTGGRRGCWWPPG